MTFKGDIKSNFKQFHRHMKRHIKQVDYAASRAINDVSADARKSAIAQAKHAQKSNRAWWANRGYGIRRVFANKHNVRGAVFTKIYWGHLQELGGTKRPKGRHLVVPDTAFPKSRRKAGGIKEVLGQKTVFENDGHIYRRIGGKKSRKVRRLASLVDSARISRPILKFIRTIDKVVERRYVKYFEKRLAQALRTARK